jgi:HK97 family phage major capsid protein
MTRELKELYDQKNTAFETMKGLASKAKERSLSADEEKRFGNLEQEVESLNERIKVIHKTEEREAQLTVARITGVPGNGEDTEFREGVKKGEYFNANGTDLPVFSRTSESRAVEDWTRKNYDNPSALEGIGFGTIARAFITGAKNEKEQRALAEGVGSSGGYTVPLITSSQLIDRLRPKSHILSLGSNMVMMENGSKELSMAKLTGGLTVEWLAENAVATPTDPTFGQVKWAFKTLRALVVMSRELLEDSLNIEKAIEFEVARGFAEQLDTVSLLGSGTGAEPQGIVNFTNVNSVSKGANGGAVTNYTDILDAIELMHSDNSEDPTGMIAAPRTFRTFAGLADTTGQPLRRPFTIENLPFRQTSKIGIADVQGTSTNASKIFLGDFTQLYWGVRTGIHLIPLNQRYAEYNQIGFLAVMRSDLMPYNEESFAKIVGVIP